MQASVLLMIHRLADDLPPEYAREIQRVNYDVFRRMKKHAMPEG